MFIVLCSECAPSSLVVCLSSMRTSYRRATPPFPTMSPSRIHPTTLQSKLTSQSESEHIYLLCYKYVYLDYDAKRIRGSSFGSSFPHKLRHTTHHKHHPRRRLKMNVGRMMILVSFLEYTNVWNTCAVCLKMLWYKWRITVE